MGIFDSFWDKAAAMLDRPVDTILGDRMRYRRGSLWLGGDDQEICTIPGFVINDVAPVGGTDGFDAPLGARKRVKIAVATIDFPMERDRLQHPKLGAGTFRPSGELPENDGRYWTFDVQRVV